MELRQLEISMKVAKHMSDEIAAIPSLKDSKLNQQLVILLAGEIIGAAGALPSEVRCDVMRIVTASIVLHEQEIKQFHADKRKEKE